MNNRYEKEERSFASSLLAAAAHIALAAAFIYGVSYAAGFGFTQGAKRAKTE